MFVLHADIQHYEFMDGPVEDELRSWSKKHGPERLSGGGGDVSSSCSSLRLADFASVQSHAASVMPGSEPRLVDFASPVRHKRLRSFAHLGQEVTHVWWL